LFALAYESISDGSKGVVDILSDAVNLCIVFKFSHTNRKHPLSPDGWALLQTKKAYHTDIWDFIDN